MKLKNSPFLVKSMFGNKNNSLLIFGLLFVLFFSPFLLAQSSDTTTSSRVLNPLESAAHRTGDFLQSLVLAIVGFLLFFIVAPFLMYKSEFQRTLQNFTKYLSADSSSPANGNVYLFGPASLKGSNTHPMLGKTNCIYYDYVKEKLVITQKVVCGSEAEGENVEKISPAPDKCRKVIVTENGQDVEKTVCEKCWNANVKEWQKDDENLSTPSFKIGQNSITPNEKTKYYGDIQNKENSLQKGGTTYREKISYLELTDGNFLAARNATKGVMSKGEPFVVSSKDFESTKALIAAEQNSWILVLKVLGFISFLLGMYLILNPIPSLINILGAIPLLGGIFSGLAGITGGLILILSLVVAIVMTIILTVVFKVLRAITDNIFAVIGITIVIGLILMFVLGKIH